ncbi:MAG TPA: folylpolyglutamate synthase/dihydrofolate synthase family protein [Longimicrobiales bacterium]|nr:folylpolyglutamate synthase/dihydrofolate synthase family protein [Longimicrobiales bacterium]
MADPGRPGAGRPLAPDRLDRPFADPLVGRLFPPLATGVHWGLERTERALEALGDPHRACPALHVGGTNGKGSVAATLAAVLDESGLRTGCFTSPHLCSFRERIVVGGEALTEDELMEGAEDVREVVVRFGLTFFEAVTVLGFHCFAKAGVDVAVMEVGLGGRLDATNVVLPVASAVTNVEMDHADFLGDTLALIAREKAGIVKPGVPFVTAERNPELLELFRGIARERGAPFWVVDPLRDVREVEVARDHTSFTLHTRSWGNLRVRTPLVGRHQAGNAALAVGILEHLPEALKPTSDAVLRGIAGVVHPGRDQIEVLPEGTWLFDVAHNTAGILSLVDTLDRLTLPRPFVPLVGVLGDKDWRAMLPPLFRRADAAVLTQPPSAPPERRWDAAAAAGAVGSACPLHVEEDFIEAMRMARREARQGTVVVTGSCHTVGSALSVLGLEPLRR